MESPKIIDNEAFHAAIEFPWKKSFMSLMRPVVTEEIIAESKYVFSKELPGFIQNNWHLINDSTLIDPFRLGWILDILVRAKNVEGDIVECGSFKGGSGILMALALKELKIKKKIYLFDSFQGLPEPDANKDKGYKKGQFKSNFEVLSDKIKQLGLDDIIEIHKGWFKDTIPVFLKANPVKISMLHVDCDLYTSTYDCFPILYPLVSDKGAVILDDFNDGGRGEKRAVLELIKNDKATIEVGPAPQSFFIKGNTRIDNQFTAKDAGFNYSFKRLFEDEEYIKWFNNLIQENYYDHIASFLLRN